MEHDTPLTKQERKQKRKEERRRLREQQQLEQQQQEEQQEVAEAVEENAGEKRKKKKKKKNQQTDEMSVDTTQVEEVPVEDAAEVTEEAAPSKKEKKKKDKKRQREQQEETTQQQGENGHHENGNSNGHLSKKAKDASHKNSNRSNTNGHTKSAAGTFRKNFYKEHSSMASFTQKQVDEFRSLHNMSVSDAYQNTDYKPVRTFEDAGYPQSILDQCKGFKQPTPIQAQTWPVVLSGRDAVGIAETGSGKTLAFLLPALVHILDQPAINSSSPGPIVLVVAPTRELAMQTAEVAEKVGGALGLRSVCVYGGVPKPPQQQALRKGVHIVVGTTGRLLDLISDGSCTLSRVTYLVLDEADRMLDMGFEPDIRRIVSYLRADRQTVMFSATWPTAIQKLAHEFLSQPVKVTIGSEDLSANHRVKQIVEVVEPHHKDRKLIDLLNKYHKSRKNRVLVFALYKKEATRLEEFLTRQRYACVAIHADKSQATRTQALEQFKSGDQPLLIATDVAARGLDIPDVEVVINYTFPLTIEDYIHRIGRTGRAGKEGLSHTFFTAHDKGRAAELSSVLREADQPVPEDLLPLCSAGTKKKEHKLYGAHFKEVNPADLNKQPTKIKFADSDDE